MKALFRGHLSVSIEVFSHMLIEMTKDEFAFCETVILGFVCIFLISFQSVF